MSDGVVLHLNLLSQPCRSVWLICKISKVPFEVVNIDFKKGEHKTEAFAQINPFKSVPSVQDGSIRINESCAALRHLAVKYDKSKQWYPTDEVDRARTDEYLDWQHHNTRKHGVGIFFNKMIAPMFTGKPFNEDLVNGHIESLGRVEELIISYFLKSTPFIGGSKPSIADISACCELEQPIQAGYEYSQPILDYIERVENSIGEEYGEAHASIRNFNNQF